MKRCTGPQCRAAVRCRGLCASHYAQERRGMALRPVKRQTHRGYAPRGMSAHDRAVWYLENMAEREPTTGCLVWQGWTNGQGTYGSVKTPGLSQMTAHRFIYSALVEPVPDGLQVDHLCRNTLCVNPEHLEAVTPKENCRRKPRKRK